MPGGRDVAVRSTEGVNRDTASTYKAGETKRQRGRPKGSKNKAKPLISKEMQVAILEKLLPAVADNPEQTKYLKDVITKGAPVDVAKELDSLILLLSQQTRLGLLAEMQGEQLPEGVEDPEQHDSGTLVLPELRKDVTERLKVLLSMIDVKMRHERARDDGDNSGEQPIIKIFANRGLVGDRLRIAFEHTSGGVGRSTDESESESNGVGDVPVALLERPISLPGRGESTADRTVNDDIVGDSARSVHEVEVSG